MREQYRVWNTVSNYDSKKREWTTTSKEVIDRDSVSNNPPPITEVLTVNGKKTEVVTVVLTGIRAGTGISRLQPTKVRIADKIENFVQWLNTKYGTS